jgi:hypothetical protein
MGTVPVSVGKKEDEKEILLLFPSATTPCAGAAL